jgi:hypothetical protein
MTGRFRTAVPRKSWGAALLFAFASELLPDSSGKTSVSVARIEFAAVKTFLNLGGELLVYLLKLDYAESDFIFSEIK